MYICINKPLGKLYKTQPIAKLWETFIHYMTTDLIWGQVQPAQESLKPWAAITD